VWTDLASDDQWRPVAKSIPAQRKFYIVNTQFNFWADGYNHTFLEQVLAIQRGDQFIYIDGAIMDHPSNAYPVSQANIQHQFHVLGRPGFPNVAEVLPGDQLVLWGRGRMLTYLPGTVGHTYDENGNPTTAFALMALYGWSLTNPNDPVDVLRVPHMKEHVATIETPCQQFNFYPQPQNLTVSRQYLNGIHITMEVPPGVMDQPFLFMSSGDGQHLAVLSPEDYAGNGGIFSFNHSYYPDVLKLNSRDMSIKLGTINCNNSSPFRTNIIFR
jgi:hypothetical protein